MFVRSSTYEEMRVRAKLNEVCAVHWKEKYEAMVKDWNKLVRKVNASGGIGADTVSDQFSADDLKRLLMLCHPDKHDGKQMATEMTTKLLKLKEKLK